MSKALKIIIVADVILLLAILGLLLVSSGSKSGSPGIAGTLREIISGEPASTPSEQPDTENQSVPQNTGEDLSFKATYSGVEDNYLKVTLATGKIEEYLLIDKLFVLCLDTDLDEYNKFQGRDYQEISSDYLINTDEISSKVEPGQEIELFLYKYSATETLVKGVALSTCD